MHRVRVELPHRAAYYLWSVPVDKRDQVLHDVNPFGVQMEAPMQANMTVHKWAPKIDDVGDIGRIGSTHSGGDWG